MCIFVYICMWTYSMAASKRVRPHRWGCVGCARGRRSSRRPRRGCRRTLERLRTWGAGTPRASRRWWTGASDEGSSRSQRRFLERVHMGAGECMCAWMMVRVCVLAYVYVYVCMYAACPYAYIPRIARGTCHNINIWYMHALHRAPRLG